MLSMHDDERYLFEALKAGASGYVLKREADQDLVGAVRAVGRGEAFLTNAAERSLIREWMADDTTGPAVPLTPREEEVVKLIAEAHTNAQIAEAAPVREDDRVASGQRAQEAGDAGPGRARALCDSAGDWSSPEEGSRRGRADFPVSCGSRS
jgi:FixJ family two-component response regulator